MASGNIKFENALRSAESTADKIELQLPHVADEIYRLVKLVRIYDKNFLNLMELAVDQQKALKYVSKFLTKREIRKLDKYMEKRKKGRK